MHPLLSLLLACTPQAPDRPKTTTTSTSTSTTTTPSTDTDTDTTAPCDAEVGTFHEQTLEVDGETRTYLLHVPSTYACAPTPVLFDLHGTAVGRPEEAYGLQGALDAAEAEGFLLVRPRSRSSLEGGQEVFRWDQNPGDPERNRVFLRALLDDLRERYAVADDRVYVMGFSSGTNQTSVMAADPDTPFHGFGHVGGGAWTVDTQQPAGRFYLHTPWRDYMRTYDAELRDLLDEAGVPSADRLDRQSFSGHELYDWVYPELWAFLDRGERPDPGVLAAGWTEVPGAPTELLGVDVDPDGLAWLTGADGSVVAYDGAAFVAAPIAGSSVFAVPALTSVCLLPDGRGAAVGNGTVLWTDDGGGSWRHLDPLSEPGPPMFGYTHWNGVGCGDDVVLGLGYWSAGTSADGLDWADAAMGSTYRAQGQAAAQGPTGTWVSVGYYRWLGRSTDAGATFQQVGSTGPGEWLLDVAAVAPGVWVVVGDGGVILRSDDDGASFDVVAQTGIDLYAVAFEGDHGMAVGRAGQALVSLDAGATWSDVSLGRDVMLSDVAALPTGEALVVGEGGPYLTAWP
ncbi:MAG: hypothetical protein R3F59_27360 [Myxococcota bacterium]